MESKTFDIIKIELNGVAKHQGVGIAGEILVKKNPISVRKDMLKILTVKNNGCSSSFFVAMINRTWEELGVGKMYEHDIL